MSSETGPKTNRELRNQQIHCLDRRRLIKGAITGMSDGLLGIVSGTQAQALLGSASLRFGVEAKQAFKSTHVMQPLSFKPSKLEGLSERLMESHWANNYGGSVRALNATHKRLVAALSYRDLSAFTYNGLKSEHLMRTCSVVLHELYFENLGGDGKAGADVRKLIADSFGTFDRWESEYRRIAAGLGGGSGWVMLGSDR